MLARQEKVYNRHDEQGKQSSETHAAYDYPADLMARFRTGTGRQCKRDSAQNHRACSHQNWP